MPREGFVNVSLKREAKEALERLQQLLNLPYSELIVYIERLLEDNRELLEKLENMLRGEGQCTR